MRLSQKFLTAGFVLIFTLLCPPSFAQGHVAMGGISGGGGIDGSAEVVGVEGQALLVRCPDLQVYRCDSRCGGIGGGNAQVTLQLFCLEVMEGP